MEDQGSISTVNVILHYHVHPQTQYFLYTAYGLSSLFVGTCISGPSCNHIDLLDRYSTTVLYSHMLVPKTSGSISRRRSWQDDAGEMLNSGIPPQDVRGGIMQQLVDIQSAQTQSTNALTQVLLQQGQTTGTMMEIMTKEYNYKNELRSHPCRDRHNNNGLSDESGGYDCRMSRDLQTRTSRSPLRNRQSER